MKPRLPQFRTPSKICAREFDLQSVMKINEAIDRSSGRAALEKEIQEMSRSDAGPRKNGRISKQ